MGQLWKPLLLFFLSSISHHTVSVVSKCQGEQDVFAAVTENSPMGRFIANINISGDPAFNPIDLHLDGTDADWLFLDGQTIRLNSSDTKVLDREVHGEVLLANVKCYEDRILHSEHRITVDILNQNDNKPEFLQSTIQHIQISELTTVNSIAFTVQATDADEDGLVYSIDNTLPDASYFRVDLPNTGQIILNRSLNYETRTQLKLQLYAFEVNTTERYSTTATLTINVIDADDQYPQFQPCILISHSRIHVCVNPLYTVNITENDEAMILDFSPGPIQAVDGDEGLRTPLTYTILSGSDNGRFLINTESGEIKLTRRVENRFLMPTLRLRIMAAQRDDPMKYSVATALVQVLAENQFQPQFSRSTYHGFVIESSSPASIVITYGKKLLILKAEDRDFIDGINTKLQYSLSSKTNCSELYYVTQEGLVIGKANQLKPKHNHTLEVLATDQESGDVVKAVIYINVLEKEEPVPQGPLEERQDHGSKTLVVEGLPMMCLVQLAITTIVLMCFVRKRRVRQNPAEHADIADNKHPNVTLRRFHYLVNQREPLPLVEEVFYYNETFGGYDASISNLHGKQGVYTHRDQNTSTKSSLINLPLNNMSLHAINCSSQNLKSNKGPVVQSINKSVWFRGVSMVNECKDENKHNVKDAQLVKLVYTETLTSEKDIDKTECETSNTVWNKASHVYGTEMAFPEELIVTTHSDQIITERVQKYSGTSFIEQHRCPNEQEANQSIGKRIHELNMQMHQQLQRQR